MALEEYRRKRDFRITSEPSDKAKARTHKKPIFVIQEHHATRLHYDFRLEADGVLKSWAVTKEPTLDPKIRRLAIEVEDHPIAYATFSGDIPEGQYGAGHVEIWDKGTYEFVPSEKEEATDVVEGIDAGRLEVELHGAKLKGRFILIRTGERSGRNQWLLMKRKDEFAVEGIEREGERASGRGGDGAKERVGERERGRGGVVGSAKALPRSGRVRQKGSVPDEVRTTNEDKVMFPEAGITKGDVLAYYERIAPLMIPHLKDRPVTLERLPDGLGEGKPRFWQKNTPAYYPSWIPRVELPSETGKPVSYALVNDPETLLYLVNQGAITFHVWMSRITDLDRPDFVLFDLDPGERSFDDVINVARTLHEILVDRTVEAAVKTSGKSGLHVLAPWTDTGNDDVAREWAIEVAEELVRELPDLTTIERSKAKRKGRLYVDVMQNVRGHHMVAPYTLRTTPQATLSMPIEWKEVKKGLTPEKFMLRTVFRRLTRKESDPLAILAPRKRRAKATT
jgi:bifunctional non-homologous end joining protein LigD